MKIINLAVLTIILAVGQSLVLAAGPNRNVRFFGYDWIDYERTNESVARTAAVDGLQVVRSNGPAATNLNIVRTLNSLNSSACSNSSCGLGVSAGEGQDLFEPGNMKFDICAGATNYDQCVAGGNVWGNIWNITAKIASAVNRPAAIYFIDEPTIQPALKSLSGNYVPWSYASFVCTFRDAMAANSINIPIFTVLATSALPGPSRDPDHPDFIVREMRNQMPLGGCQSGRRSMPDAIGIDNYDWVNASTIYDTYNRYFPSGGTSPMWVLVPPGHSQIPEIRGMSDLDFRNRVQVYWDFMVTYPHAPIAAVMVHRYDNTVMSPGSNAFYAKTRDLLRYIGNRIIN